MPTRSTLILFAVLTPAALLVLAGTLWLWLRFGMGVYFDATMGAIAGCL